MGDASSGGSTSGGGATTELESATETEATGDDVLTGDVFNVKHNSYWRQTTCSNAIRRATRPE